MKSVIVLEVADMKDYEQLKKFIDEHNSNIITVEEFKNHDINFYYIKKLIEDNYISRKDKGIYIKSETSEDPYYTFQYRYKNTIYSYGSALYLLNKMDSMPEYMDITVPSDYHVEIENDHVRFHFTNRNNINLGVITIKTLYGNEVKTYNLERTVCDLVKFDNKCGIDPDIRRKVIRKTFDYKEIDTSLLMAYAKQLKCDKKMSVIVDILS